MVRKQVIASILLLLVIVGCGSYKLRPDPSVPATEAKYPTAEFYAQGQHQTGLGIVVLEEGQDLNAIGLWVKGYFSGTIRFSTTCNPEEPLTPPVRYRNSETVPYFLPGKAEVSCGISFVVSPEYPNEQKGKLRIYSFFGHIYVRVLKPGTSFLGFTDKIPTGTNQIGSIFVPVGNIPQAEVYFESKLCNVKYGPISLPVKDGKVEVQIKSLMPEIKVQTCVLNGYVLAEKQPIRLSWFVSGFDKAFVPLSLPKLTIKKKDLIVEGDGAVSVVNLDDCWPLTNSASFSFDPSKPHVLRLMTVKGRVVVGDYTPQKGWTWIY